MRLLLDVRVEVGIFLRRQTIMRLTSRKSRVLAVLPVAPVAVAFIMSQMVFSRITYSTCMIIVT